MSLSNLSELLLRNQPHFTGRVLLVAPPEDLTLTGWGEDTTGLTTDYGQWQRGLDRGESWLFGLDDPAASTGFDHVVVAMPKARAELGLRLDYAAASLNPSGRLWLAGEKRGGIAGGAKVFQSQWPEAGKVDTARHCQLWVVSPGSATPGAFDLSGWYGSDAINAAGQDLTVASLPGIFSEGRLDPGTALLLSTFRDAPKGPVLDFACGAGIIGAWLLQRWPDLEMDLLDAQWQALACARRTLADVENARVVPGDGLAGLKGKYGLIVTNPPFHQGVRADLSVTTQFLQQVGKHLKPGGELRLVANSHLPYPEQMEKTVGKVSVLADDGRYRVYQANLSRRPAKRR